jgi:mono/diheme cytochrome c family protein
MRATLLAVMVAALVAAAALARLVGRYQETARGARLYAENCASCHGENLEGQPDWMERLPNGRLPAPPHDASGHTWHHSDADLRLITGKGMAAIVPDYQSDMPAFGSALDEGEIEAILDFIKSTWPERERAYQAAQTGADQAR